MHYDALRARLLLMFGGYLGLHYVYLDEPLEAFAYFATGGIFLFGVFYDVFAIHTIVRERNALHKRLQDERGDSTYGGERLVSCSIKRFIAQFLFGYWLGLIYGLAALFTFTENRPFLMSFVVALGVSKGVFVAGNARQQRRNVLFIWMASFFTCFIFIATLQICLLRTLLFASLLATLVGNRSARSVAIGSRRYSYRTYLFLCAIYCVIIMGLAYGLTQCILNRRVVAISAKHHSRITSSIGQILYDRYVNMELKKSIFTKDAEIHYLMSNVRRQPMSPFNMNSAKFERFSSAVPPRRSPLSPPSPSSSLSNNWWWWMTFGYTPPSDDDYDYDDKTLVDYLVVLVADYLRAEALSRMSTTNDGQQFDAVPWTAWRMLAIYATSSSPYISDNELLQKCEALLKDFDSANHIATIDWRYYGVKKAYGIIRSISQL